METNKQNEVDQPVDDKEAVSKFLDVVMGEDEPEDKSNEDEEKSKKDETTDEEEKEVDEDEDEDEIEDADSEEEDDSDEDEDEDEDDKPTEIDLLKQQLEEEREERRKILAMLEKSTVKKDTKEDDATSEDEDEISLDQIISDKDFNELSATMQWDENEETAFKSFFTKAISDYDKTVRGSIYNKLPNLINTTVTQKQQMADVKKKFYSEHPELAAVKSYVGELAKTVASENESEDLEDILNKTAEKAYKLLGITKKKQTDEGKSKNTSKAGKSKKKPAFATTKGSRKKEGKKRDEQEKALESMLDAIL